MFLAIKSARRREAAMRRAWYDALTPDQQAIEDAKRRAADHTGTILTIVALLVYMPLVWMFIWWLTL